MYKKPKHILILLLFATLLLFAEEPSWEVIGKMKYPVSGARAVVYNEMIYVIGGYSDSLQANVKWIQQYDPATHSWKIVAKMIEKRYGFVAGIHYDKLYIYGGINEVNDNSYIIEEWDFQSSSTTSFYTNELFDRVFSTGTISGDNFIMIGGYAASRGSGAALPYISSFNFQLLQINSIDDTSYLSNELPIQQMSVRVEDKLYVLGGAFNGVLQNFTSINLNDFSSYEFDARIISPRAAGVSVYSTYTDMIYLIGGYNENSPAIASTEIIANFNSSPIISDWAELIYARRNISAVVFNEKIYVFGGENSSGQVVPYIETISAKPTGVDKEQNLPFDIQLHQNYPNPFNPETNISYFLERANNIELEIFNSLGVKIKTIYKGYSLPGNYSHKWSGDNEQGNQMPSGIYFYRISAQNNVITKKMLLLK